jgi:hypothetical protein
MRLDSGFRHARQWLLRAARTLPHLAVHTFGRWADFVTSDEGRLDNKLKAVLPSCRRMYGFTRFNH